jgi:hypothetical protein
MITNETKQQFNQALIEELGCSLSQHKSDELLTDLVKYYRLMAKLNKHIETPPEAQN